MLYVKNKQKYVFTVTENDLPVIMGGVNVDPFFVETVNILISRTSLVETENLLKNRTKQAITLSDDFLAQVTIDVDSFYKAYYTFDRFYLSTGREKILAYVETIFGAHKFMLTDEEIYYMMYVAWNFEPKDYTMIRKELLERNPQYTDTIVSFTDLQKIRYFVEYLYNEGEPVSKKNNIKYAVSITPEAYCNLKNEHELKDTAIGFFVDSGFTDPDTILSMHDSLPSELYEV